MFEPHHLVDLLAQAQFGDQQTRNRLKPQPAVAGINKRILSEFISIHGLSDDFRACFLAGRTHRQKIEPKIARKAQNTKLILPNHLCIRHLFWRQSAERKPRASDRVDAGL